MALSVVEPVMRSWFYEALISIGPQGRRVRRMKVTLPPMMDGPNADRLTEETKLRQVKDVRRRGARWHLP